MQFGHINSGYCGNDIFLTKLHHKGLFRKFGVALFVAALFRICGNIGMPAEITRKSIFIFSAEMGLVAEMPGGLVAYFGLDVSTRLYLI